MAKTHARSFKLTFHQLDSGQQNPVTFLTGLENPRADIYRCRMSHMFTPKQIPVTWFDQIWVTCSVDGWVGTDIVQNNQCGSLERMVSQKIILRQFLKVEEMNAGQANIFDICLGEAQWLCIEVVTTVSTSTPVAVVRNSLVHCIIFG